LSSVWRTRVGSPVSSSRTMTGRTLGRFRPDTVRVLLKIGASKTMLGIFSVGPFYDPTENHHITQIHFTPLDQNLGRATLHYRTRQYCTVLDFSILTIRGTSFSVSKNGK
jgi:hypothetical protein